MLEIQSIHDLVTKLETSRRQEIEELAAVNGDLHPESRLACLQAVLDAVRDEIKAHEVKEGYGGSTKRWV